MPGKAYSKYIILLGIFLCVSLLSIVRADYAWIRDEILTASDADSYDHFGHSVSLDCNTVIVGTVFDEQAGANAGSAYVFIREQNGWVEQEKLLASDAAENSLFGSSVSVSGDYAIVGAPWHEIQGVGDKAGAAYIFELVNLLWTEKIILAHTNIRVGDQFGAAVTIFGTYAAVGAPMDDDYEQNSGSVFVYTRNASSWQEQDILRPSNANQNDQFGSSLDMHGDRLIVGAPNHDPRGAAYIFSRNGSEWEEQAILLSPQGETAHDFGVSVSIWEDYAVVGASHHTGPGNYRGASYVYHYEDGQWEYQATLQASGDPLFKDDFGQAVSIQGNIIAVGANKQTNGPVNHGMAYIFERQGDQWQLDVELFPADTEVISQFGASISVDRNRVVVGAPEDVEAGPAEAGAAYVYEHVASMIYHVDGKHGKNGNDGLTYETAFATIQHGIDTARDGDVVSVWPGVYQEDVNFLQKAITLQSAADAAILKAKGLYAVSFIQGEGRGSVLQNFVIRNSYTGIHCEASSPTIRFVTVVKNEHGLLATSGAKPEVSNSIFWLNTNCGICDGTARWSCLQDSMAGAANIHMDPNFANPAKDDFHLKSSKGRYLPVDPNYFDVSGLWVLDETMSPCVDAGDPYVNPNVEPESNGGRVNMGAYGNTEYASRGEWPLAADINRDRIVNLKDLAILAQQWLDDLPEIY
jgi:hypothetical protein